MINSYGGNSFVHSYTNEEQNPNAIKTSDNMFQKRDTSRIILTDP